MSSALAAGVTTAKVLDWSEQLTLAAIHGGIAVGAAFVLHLALFALLRRAARLSVSKSDDVVFDRLRQPLRWALIAVAVAIAQENDALLARGWEAVARFIVPALLGWIAFAMVKAFAAVMDGHAEASDDPLVARSRQTRAAILSRAAGFMIVFITVALVLFAIPAVRAVGVTIMASAGIVTLAVGAAAQPALKSLIAGMQIALTEPIRIGDFVVVEGESGRVEDIRLSYVVIRTGDERRVIVPTGKFLDSSFQNWTRVGGGITGSVVLPVRPGQPLGPIREAYQRLLGEQADWDKRTGTMQVSEARVGSVELKLVMSAADPAKLARLRLAMREAMLEWLRSEMPDALCVEA